MSKLTRALHKKYLSEKRVEVLNSKLDLVNKSYRLYGGLYLKGRDKDLAELVDLGLVVEVNDGSFNSPLTCYRPVVKKKRFKYI